MGESPTTARLRMWSAARWTLTGVLSIAQGVTGWYFTMFGVYGLEDFQGVLAVSMFALPASLLLIVLDFRTASQRGCLRAWLVLRAIAVPTLGIGIGSLIRVWIVTGGSTDVQQLVEPHAAHFAWQLTALGAALLTIQPLVAGVRRVTVTVFGAPQASDRDQEAAGRSRATARTATAGARAEAVTPAAPKWPGRPRAKAVAGTVAFALIASAMLVLAGRVYWHIGAQTMVAAQPMVATGTVDGRELVVLGYDEINYYWLSRNQRIAAYDLKTGELVWDRKLQGDDSIPVSVDAVQLDERGAFVRVDDPSRTPTWFVLDPSTGKTEATAEEGNLLVIDDLDEAAPGIPGDAVERYIERDRLVPDEGYDYEFTDDADLERVFRYEDESLLINPATGKPAGADHGFTLHGICCNPPALETRAEDGSVLWRRDDATPSPRDIVAETESGRVVLLLEGPESKIQLVSVRGEAAAEAVVGDRGWLPW